MVPAAGLIYTAAAATRTEPSNGSGLGLQIVTTEARVERSDGTEAMIRRVYKDLPPESPIVNGGRNYSIMRYFTVEEVSIEIRPRGATATVHQVTRNDCDKAGLASFLPLGHVQRVTVACRQTQIKDGVAQAPSPYTLTVSYEGKATVSGAFGDVVAHRIRMSWTVADLNTEGVISFDDSRGLILNADYTVSRGNFRSSTHSTITSITP